MGIDLWVRTGNGPPGGVPLITGEGHQGQPQLSSDSEAGVHVDRNRSKRSVRRLDSVLTARPGRSASAKSVPDSDGGGFAPRWRGDGKELFYLKADGR